MIDATAKSFARSLAALMRGHLYPGSEGDAPYRPFAAPLAGRTLDAAAFTVAARVPRGWSVDFQAAEEWLTAQARPEPAPIDDAARAECEAYAVLTKLMHAGLHGRLHLAAAIPPLERLSTFHRTRRYLVGNGNGTHVIGLVAYSVET
ncbi:hypothetical protein GCM10027517_21320 [Phycicoccus ginsengisoli]